MKSVLTAIILCVCGSNYTNAQTACLNDFKAYRKAVYKLTLDKKPKSQIEAITLLLGSASFNDSLIIFIDSKKFKIITPKPLESDADYKQNAVILHLNSIKKKSFTTTIFSLKQKQYISLKTSNLYRLVRVDFYSDTCYVSETNKPLQIE